MAKLKSKKAQISTQFAWIFILIAGAIILIFFISLVFKQKEISETRLSATVLSQLETILVGSGLSSGTVNVIDMPETELNFVCDEDGFSEFAIEGTVLTKETPTQVIFTPEKIKGRQIITWALSFDAPFKTTNFLYLSDPTTKYVFVTPNTFAQEIMQNFPAEFKPESTTLSSINPQGYNKIKLIFSASNPPDTIPDNLEDIDVSAIKLTSNSIIFYKTKRSSFEQEDTISYIDEPSLYGAIFAEDQTSYECNMRKAFKRLNLVAQVYEYRKEDIELDSSFLCKAIYQNSVGALSLLINNANACNEHLNNNCMNTVRTSRDNLQAVQNNLIRESCLWLY
ncbi:MAG: hypothetical protein V3V78_00565 [Candidatus Woesearchaeota archaeon]